MALEPDGKAAGCNPVEVGSIPTSVSNLSEIPRNKLRGRQTSRTGDKSERSDEYRAGLPLRGDIQIQHNAILGFGRFSDDI